MAFDFKSSLEQLKKNLLASGSLQEAAKEADQFISSLQDYLVQLERLNGSVNQSAQVELLVQKKRIEALYEVSRSLQVQMDPALVTLKGLRTLISATGSDCGFACFYERAGDKFEIVAAEGLSASYIDSVNAILSGDTLVRYSVRHKQGLLLSNIQDDPRAAVDIAKSEGLRATIIMPLMFEGKVQGAIILSSKKLGHFAQADFDLVTAACNQLGIAVYQAELYASERRQSNSLAALYRLSHELSKHLTAKEVAEHALPIIQEELACKRMWFGVVNEQGTHIVGQAGFGPGVRRNLIDIQIELSLRHDFLDEALEKRRAIIVHSGSKMECSGLNRIMQRLNLGTFVIVPLVALGQVVGILVVEPAVPSAFLAQRRLPLLSNMGGEIASVILARRFEAKIAESHKMRMAGLLSSAVAHNFNNLLQAVVGQASLIEIQAGQNQTLLSSARMIMDAANKGASLVKQLFSLTRQDTHAPTNLEINNLLKESQEIYRSALGSVITLEISLDPEAPTILADAGQVQEVLMNLLVNARDAVSADNGQVKILTKSVKLRSGEVDPELSPGHYLRIDIVDNGRGMDLEQQMRCFEPFYSTKNTDSRTGISFAGAGLGLASAYSIIRQHGGIITVHSRVNEGATFSVYLPASRSDSSVVSGDAQSPVRRLPDQVVICGFENDSEYLIKSTLQAMTCKINSCSSLQEIIERIEAEKARDVLIIFDADNSQFNGLELLRRFGKESARITMVAATKQAKRWSRYLRLIRGLEIIEKPIGIWSIQSIMRDLYYSVERKSLYDRLEIINDANGQKKANTDLAITKNKSVTGTEMQ